MFRSNRDDEADPDHEAPVSAKLELTTEEEGGALATLGLPAEERSTESIFSFKSTVDEVIEDVDDTTTGRLGSEV